MPKPDAAISDSARRAAADVRVTFSRLRRRLREVAAFEGLTPTQTSVLSRLTRTDGLTASALATAEGVKPQSMATTVAGLVEQGIVVREQDPDDGRRQLLRVTAAGRARIDVSRQAREEWLSRVMQDRFTQAERRTVIEAMALLDTLVDVPVAP